MDLFFHLAVTIDDDDEEEDIQIIDMKLPKYK